MKKAVEIVPNCLKCGKTEHLYLYSSSGGSAARLTPSTVNKIK
jgi:hypothetical protein